jgi:hypothetical protein
MSNPPIVSESRKSKKALLPFYTLAICICDMLVCRDMRFHMLPSNHGVGMYALTGCMRRRSTKVGFDEVSKRADNDREVRDNEIVKRAGARCRGNV